MSEKQSCNLARLMFFLGTYILSGFFDYAILADQTLKPNEMGLIPMIEYHRIGNAERSFTRSIDNFKNDLKWLYNNDYVLISVNDFISQKIDIPKGKKALMISFDDSTESQFRYLDDGLTIDPDSAVGILDNFYADYPEFGRTVVFFVNATLFDQPELKKRKVDYLLATGKEIGNHTYNHSNLSNLSKGEIEAAIGSLQEYLNNLILRDIPLSTFAYPFGGIPKSQEALNAVKDGAYNKIFYAISTAFLVGADPSHPPYSVKFNALKIPRIQATQEEWKRWFGREESEITSNPDSELFTPFVSDGCLDLLTIPEKRIQNLDKAKIREGLELCVLEKEDCEKKAIEKGCFAKISESVTLSGSLTESLNPKILSGSNVQSPVVLKDFNIFQRWFDRGQESFLAFLTIVREQTPDFNVNTLPADLHFGLSGYAYTVKEGDTISKIVTQFLPYTKYYLAYELKEALLKENNLSSESINKDQALIIPGVELVVYDMKPKMQNYKGIYWTAYTASSSTSLAQIEQLKANGGNTVVFDVKEIEGMIFYDTKISLAKEKGLVRVRINDMPKFVRTLHRNGIYAIARIVVFKDIALVKAHPDWVPKNKSNGKLWAQNGKVEWLDPSIPQVQDYNADIAEEVAKFGVDEIQFDYIRFPADGGANLADFAYDEKQKSREDIIAEFLGKVSQRLKPYNVRLSADLFGIVAWNENDGRIVGQNIKRMAEYLDVIYPMVYPSHFSAGFNKVANPGGEPYLMVSESMKKFIKLSDKDTLIIPWIQGFSWGATGYGTEYVRKQIQAARDLGVDSFIIWNAANNYEVSWGAIR